MFKIIRKKQLNEQVVLFEIEAPFIAAKAEAGQFIIFRLDEQGERVPLTIADYDRQKGSITIIFQTVGASTMKLGELNEGDYISDVVGPLGTPTEYGDNIRKVAVIGGGPVGIESLAASLGHDRDTLENVVEPYIIQQGFVQRTRSGRMAGRRAYEKFGMQYPGAASSGED